MWRACDGIPQFTKNILKAVTKNTEDEIKRYHKEIINSLKTDLTDFENRSGTDVDYIKTKISSLKKEIEYMTKNIYFKQVPVPISFRGIRGRLEFVMNDMGTCCSGCGADIPDSMYLYIAYQRLCQCCLE
jgi:hypothetical protein